MGNDVSIILHPDAPVPSTVLATQREVYAASNLGDDTSVSIPSRRISSPSNRRVVRRCPRISVMTIDKAQQLVGGCIAANVSETGEKTTSPPLVEQRPPVVLLESCAESAAFAAPSAYVNVVNAFLSYEEDHMKESSLASRGACPIGINFDPSICLGERLRTSEVHTSFAEYCDIFLAHLIRALEHAGCDAQAGPSPTTASAQPPVKAAAAAAPTMGTVPLRLFILYLDARSCRLDDTSGPWFASSLIMRAVRRARPYARVMARTNAVVGSGGADHFMSYFTPKVKADMLWASLQHVLLAHNDMSLQGVQAVLENLLAEDATQDVLLQQQGVDARAHKWKEVTAVVLQNRLFPRQHSHLLPQLYHVDVRHNLYDDSEVYKILQSTTPCTGVPTAPLQRPLKVSNGVPDVSPTDHNAAGLYEYSQTTSFCTHPASLGLSTVSVSSAIPTPKPHLAPMPHTSPAALAAQESNNGEDISHKCASTATQNGSPLRNLSHLHASLQQSPRRFPVSQTSRRGSDHHGGTAPGTTSASKSLSTGALSQVLSFEALTPSAAATPTVSQPLPIKSNSVAAHPRQSEDATEHKQRILLAHELAQTTTLLLKRQGGGRRMQLESRPTGDRVRSPKSFPESSQAEKPKKVSTTEKSSERLLGDFIMKGSGHLLQNFSPHSKARVGAPVISLAPQSPRASSARKPTLSPHPLDVAALQRAYKVMRAQRSHNGGAPLAVPSSNPTTPRQRINTRKGPSNVARTSFVEMDRAVHRLREVGTGVDIPRQRTYSHPHRSLRHLGSDSGHAEMEPWLDEILTQSQGRGNLPEPGIRGRRRCYDIPALAPPDGLFAAAAAGISPTVWERGGHRPYASPTRVASQRSGKAAATRSSTLRPARLVREKDYDHARTCDSFSRDPDDAQLARAEGNTATAASAEEIMRDPRRTRRPTSERLISKLRFPLSARHTKARHPSPTVCTKTGMQSGCSSLSCAARSPPPEASMRVRSAAFSRSTNRNGVPAGAAPIPGSARTSPAPRHHRRSTPALATMPENPRQLRWGHPHCALHGTATSLEERKPHLPAWQYRERDSGGCNAARIAATSPSQGGMATPSLRKWNLLLSHASSEVNLLMKSKYTSTLLRAAEVAVSEPEYNENGIELVHMKLRTRTL